MAWRDVRGLSIDLVVVFVVDAVVGQGGSWWEGRNIGEKLLIVGYGKGVVGRLGGKCWVWGIAVWGFLVSVFIVRAAFGSLWGRVHTVGC